MILNRVFVLICSLQICCAIIFDYYTAKKATLQQIEKYQRKGNLDVCTVDIEPCCATDRKRVDGSCNNIDDPIKGTNFIPPSRLLPACYYNGSYPRKAVSGKDLELARVIRTTLLSEGKISDSEFSQSMPSYGVFMFVDVGSGHDVLYRLQNKTDCCGKGMNDTMCAPIIVPKSDHIHKLTGITCLNMTRPLTHQFYGCTEDPKPSPIDLSTGAFDLSQIYNLIKGSDKAVRSYKDGKLAVDVRNGKTFPPTGGTFCPLNQPDEKLCFANYQNELITTSLFVIWFVRQHNHFATQLAKVNPCWDDETLFQVARDINIAFALNVYLYEWLVQLIGFENLVKAGVISRDRGFRDIYDSSMVPGITHEYTYVLRWFHTVQEATAQMYDTDGRHIGDQSLLELSFRSGFLPKNKNIEYLTQGHFRQPCGKIDSSIDYEVANHGMPGIQRSVDITTNDLYKGRLLGFSPYVDYLQYCTGHLVKDFSDLLKHVDEEKIHELKKVYADVKDIELLSGIWMEKIVDGGKIPRTLACILNDNMLKSIKGDRHWFESPNRPHAFTKRQLFEIRKANLALLLCTNGDGVTEVQKHAFLTISPKNPLVKCSQIPSIDFTAWRDPKCF